MTRNGDQKRKRRQLIERERGIFQCSMMVHATKPQISPAALPFPLFCKNIRLAQHRFPPNGSMETDLVNGIKGRRKKTCVVFGVGKINFNPIKCRFLFWKNMCDGWNNCNGCQFKIGKNASFKKCGSECLPSESLVFLQQNGAASSPNN